MQLSSSCGLRASSRHLEESTSACSSVHKVLFHSVPTERDNFYSTVLFSTFSDIKMQNEINSTKYRGLLILKWKNRGYTELSIAMTASYSRITTSRYWRILGRTWLLNMQLATILRINQSTLFVNIVTSTIELSTMTRERSTEFQAVFYSRPIDKQIDQTQLSYIFFKLFWCCNKFANLVQS